MAGGEQAGRAFGEQDAGDEARGDVEGEVEETGVDAAVYGEGAAGVSR